MKSVMITFGAAVIAAIGLTPSFAFASTCFLGKASTISISERLTPEAIAQARAASIIPVSTCEYPEVAAALASKGGGAMRRAIQENRALLADLQSQGFTAADILGAVRNGPVTIYVKARENGPIVTLTVPLK